MPGGQPKKGKKKKKKKKKKDALASTQPRWVPVLSTTKLALLWHQLAWNHGLTNPPQLFPFFSTTKWSHLKCGYLWFKGDHTAKYKNIPSFKGIICTSWT